MRACGLFTSGVREYRKSINPPYSKKDTLPILVTIFILLAIPLTIFAVFNVRNYRSKAANNSVRGVSGDLWADVILGQRDFGEIVRGEILPYNVRKVGGVLVDRSTNPGRAYIFDAQRSRILGIDLAKCYSGSYDCKADIVIGQPLSSDWGACNRDLSFQNYPIRVPASAQTLCGMADGVNSPDEILSFVSMDINNGRLIVPDLENHRVLVYDNPWVTNATASQVIGQTDFTGNLCNQNSAPYGSSTSQPTDSTLCFQDETDTARHGAGVAIDAKGDLWVADEGNNRVLRFPKDPTTGLFSKTANLVLGQTSFTVGPGWNHKGTGLNQMANPNSLRFGPDGKLYIADGGNNRVLVFTPNPDFTKGMAASGTFGLGLATPFIGEVDPSGAGLWINDSQNGRAVLFGWDGMTTKKTLIPAEGGSAGGIGIDAQSNVIVPRPDRSGEWVYVFNNPLANPASSINTPNRDLFHPLAPGDSDGISARRMQGGGTGIAIAANQLFVSDGGARILFWNNPTSLITGQPADGVLGQRNFETLDGNIIHGYYGQIKADADNRIWVRTNYEVRVYQAPVKIGDKPIKILKYPFNVLGGGQINEIGDTDSTGLLPTAHGEFLWFSEAHNSRVLRIKDPLGSNPVVDVILGQADATSILPNRGQTFSGDQVPPLNFLNAPGALSYDRKGNLYVSDHSLEVSGNFRLLLFPQSVIDTCTANNTKICFGPLAAKSFPEKSSQIAATWEPAFDSTNRMVVGYNAYKQGGFVGYYNDPTNSVVTPTGYLKDFSILPFGATFDKFDNLYIVDGNRSRILIYKNPFNNNPSATPDPPIPDQTTIFSVLSAGSDDLYKSCGLSLTSSDIRLGKDTGGFNCQPTNPADLASAVRFSGLNIPRGSTITNAAFSVIPSDSTAIPLNLSLYGVAADNQSTFSSTTDPNALPLTTAKADWSLNYQWGWLRADFTPKLTSIVQEIVNRPGWNSGNSIAFVIKNNGSVLNRRFISFEGADAKANPTMYTQLVVQYLSLGSDTTKTGDLNGDNKVDILDLSILLSKWGASGVAADINKDGVVNILDLSILLSNWGI